jgi:S1-C subfamily serine protease
LANSPAVGENAWMSLTYRVRRTDAVSGLALLTPAEAVQDVPYAVLSSSVTLGIGLAVVPEGAVRVGIIRVNVPGAVGANRIYSPLTEIRFEARSPTINGAPVFDPNGLLVGILSSALDGPSAAASEIGPAPPVVAFSVGPKTLARALGTLQDRTGLSQHPYVGFSYGDGPQGVVVLSISATSPANAVGLREGELIRRAGQKAVKSALDVAEYLYSLDPGEMAVFTVESKGIQRTVIIPVGRYPSVSTDL